ncbi:hypothetical protein NFG91_004238 [Salmonella enterica]|nr:hypothetical protein [Salmonella enterica]EJI5362888.1 hypothetical protein [Salmonella enterica]
MNGRKPTKAEQLYVRACIEIVGCVACRLDGLEIENPATWTEFHHDPDYGSRAPGAHFRGCGLCAPHHRGRVPFGMTLPREVAVRHPDLSNCARFSDKYGPDEFLCAYAWELIPDSIKEAIGFDISIGETPPEEKRCAAL